MSSKVKEKYTYQCGFCQETVPASEAGDRGWIPYYWQPTGTEEGHTVFEPSCPSCVEQHLTYDETEREYQRPLQ